MKNLIKFCAVILLVFGYTSCDKLDELTEVDFNTSITERIAVNVDAGENVVLNNSVMVNIDNPDTHDYLNKIKNVTINSLTYKVVSFDGDFNGMMTANLIADGVTLATHTDVLVSDEIEVLYSIDDTAKLTAIATKLKNKADVVMEVTGTATSEVGMYFQIEVTLNLKVTADAL